MSANFPGVLRFFDALCDEIRQFREFNFRVVEHGLPAGVAHNGSQVVQIHNVDAIEGPPMRFGKLSNLARRLGKRDKKRPLVSRDTR